MGLMADVGAGRVALDTAAFIYFLEEHARFGRVVAPLFEAIDAGRLAAVTSELTLMEVLVVPLEKGNAALAARYEAILTDSRGLFARPIDRSVLRTAARLRADRRLRAPDAIQVATAALEQCSAFVTNDRRLGPFRGLRVLQIEKYI